MGSIDTLAAAGAATDPALPPLVSVVIEGYNESRDVGTADATLGSLRAQDYPLERIEAIIVGSAAQAEAWKERIEGISGFHAVHFVGLENAIYYGFKNAGADRASGEIIAFTDSDVLVGPRYVSEIVRTIAAGADVSAGPTLFGHWHDHDPSSFLMRSAAAITWAWVFGRRDPGTGLPRPRGFLGHNVALKASCWRHYQYRTDLGRILAPSLLFRRISDDGLDIRITPDQRAHHQFAWRLWLVSLQFRFGHEVHRLRRLDPDFPSAWMARTGPLEPLLSFGWQVMLDGPKWVRLNRILGRSTLYGLLTLPLFLPISIIAHMYEIAGAIATQIAPRRMQQWAENV